MENKDLSTQTLNNLLKGIEEITNKSIIKEIKESINIHQSTDIYSVIENIEDSNRQI